MTAGAPPALLGAIAARVRAADMALDVVGKLDRQTFFVSGAGHAELKREVVAHRKELSFVPAHFSMPPRILAEAADAPACG